VPRIGSVQRQPGPGHPRVEDLPGGVGADPRRRTRGRSGRSHAASGDPDRTTPAVDQRRRSEIRRKDLASIANRLLNPVALPPGITDTSFSLRWLLEQLVEGVSLTQTGNLGQKFVQGAASRFGWDRLGPKTISPSSIWFAISPSACDLPAAAAADSCWPPRAETAC